LTTDDADRLENVILDISVTGVQDLNGNTMGSCAWTAYVDKNQVVWTESDKNFKRIEVRAYFTTHGEYWW
jgi:hypothetical protein